MCEFLQDRRTEPSNGWAMSAQHFRRWLTSNKITTSSDHDEDDRLPRSVVAPKHIHDEEHDSES